MDAIRVFPATLAVNQTFSIDVANTSVPAGSSVGFGLQDASGNNAFEFYFNGGAADYAINDNRSLDNDSGIPFTSAGLNVRFTLTGSNTYSLTVTLYATGQAVTQTGTLISGAGAIARVRLFDFVSAPYNLYFNNLSVAGSDDNAGNYSSWSGDFGQKPLADGPTGNGSTYAGSATSSFTISNAQVADSGNYDCAVISSRQGYTTISSASALTVNPLPVTLTGTRPYDGTATAASGVLSISDVVGSDNVNVASGSALLAGSAAGTESITNFTGLALGGTAATNYTLTGASGSVTITTAPLTITANAQSKTYGTALSLGTSAFSVGSGLVSPETVTAVTLTASGGTTANSPVSGSPYTITPGAATGANGFLAANYNISYVTNALTVNPLPVVLTGTRAYDGTATAAFNILSVANAVGGDDVNAVSGSVNLASAAVGTNAIISAGTLALGGTTASNYTLVGLSGSVVVTSAHTPPSFTALYVAGTNIVMVWNSVPGVAYQVISSTNAAAALNTWTNVGSPITATGATTTNIVPAANFPARSFFDIFR